MLDPEILAKLNEEREETDSPSAPGEIDRTKAFFSELEIEEGPNPLIKEMQRFEEEDEDLDDSDGLEDLEEADQDYPAGDYPTDDYPAETQSERRSLQDDDLKGFGELVSDFVGTAKDLLDIYFDNVFQEKLAEEFDKEERKLLDLMIFLDQEGALSYQNRGAMEEWAKQYESKLPDLISLWVRYSRIKKRYQTTPYRENYKALIEKYTYKTLRKYWGDMDRIGPEWILAATLVSVLGFDVARLFWNNFQDKRKKRKAQNEDR